MKIVVISSLLPTGHYTEILLQGLSKEKSVEIVVYTDHDPENSSVKGCGTIKPVWRKGMKFFVDILKELEKDKPDLIHIHHELNMYGSMASALLFPFLLIGMRMKGYKVVTTIHGVVSKKQIDSSFIKLFLIDRPFFITPFSLSLVFSYIYYATSFFSHRIICHTKILKNALVEYGVAKSKVDVIETAVPAKTILDVPRQNYFFYFGYMVRRKGLQQVLNGFNVFINKFPKFKLILAGGVIPGQEMAQNEIMSYIEKNHLQKNVEIKGFIKTEKELSELYGGAYAVVIPAVLSVAASGPLYQAQGYHKCILASNIGNFKEEIQHLKNGILVENDRWGETFVQIATHPGLVTEMEEGSRVRAEEKCQTNTARKYIHLYNSITTY